MTNIYLDRYYVYRCKKCNQKMSLPGIAPDIKMLKEHGWRYCPGCGEEIEELK